jgi:cellobiose-specific phosphotransferase system component IIC
MKAAWVLSAFVVLISLLVLNIAVVYQQTRQVRLSFFESKVQEKDDEVNSWLQLARTTALFVAMVAGIVAGQIHAMINLQNIDSTNKMSARIVQAFLTPQMLSGLLVSPIVFSAVYSLSRNQPDLLISMVTSFENGFFWDAVLRKRHDTQTPGKQKKEVA